MAEPSPTADLGALKFARLLPAEILAPIRDLVHESSRSRCGVADDTCPDWGMAESVLADVITAFWTAGYHLCLEGETVREGFVIKASPNEQVRGDG